jgi:hypothetical protein
MTSKPQSRTDKKETAPQRPPHTTSKAAADTTRQAHPSAAIQRAVVSPSLALSPDDLLTLQQTIGNRAVGRLMTTTAPSPVMQRKLATGRAADEHAQAADPVANGALGLSHATPSPSPGTQDASQPRRSTENRTGLPRDLKAGIENLSGMSMDNVNVHYNSSAPDEWQAHAYTRGTDIHVAPGQERHLPHEAWHVVQQKQGRVKPTVQAKGVGVSEDQGFEKEADEMGVKASTAHSKVGAMTERVAWASGATRAGGNSVGDTVLRPTVQLKNKHARKFIRDNELAIKASYEAIRDYVTNPLMPRACQQGLLDAWNLHQSAHWTLRVVPNGGVVAEACVEKEKPILKPPSPVSVPKVTPEGQSTAVAKPSSATVDSSVSAKKTSALLSELSVPVAEPSVSELRAPLFSKLSGSAPKKPLNIGEAAPLVEAGDVVDRIIHDVAVEVVALLSREVPLFREGITLGKSVVKPEVSKRKLKEEQAKKTAVKKTAVATKGSSTAEPVMTEESFFLAHRKQLKTSRLNPTLTTVLVELQRLTRLFQLAAGRVSSHSLGTNVFNYQGMNYVVNEDRYVRPYDSSYVKGKDGSATVAKEAFAAFDYPTNVLSPQDYRSIINAILREETPPVSARQMTVFIASVAAETTRYPPQLTSVMLAISGVTETLTAQKSIFAEGLTMTTGSTDPGSGSHIDRRVGFADQESASPSRATDVAAKREGAILVSAFSQRDLNLDLRGYITAELAKSRDRAAIISDLAEALINLMNLRSARLERAALQKSKLESVVTDEAIRKHFPEDMEMPARSVGSSTIVLLTPREREQLAWDLDKSRGEDKLWKDGKFRSFGVYTVILRTGSGYDVGEAHIELSTKGDSTRKRMNHWENQTWVSTPKKVKEGELAGIRELKLAAAAKETVPAKSEDIDARAVRVMDQVKQLSDKEQVGKIMAQLQSVLDNIHSEDTKVRRRALDALTSIESQFEDDEIEFDQVEALIRASMPSNEWNLMPEGWQRHAASGSGHNCLIDSLLQLTTDLDEQHRLQEAKLIRYQLIREGRTQPMAYLYGSRDAQRVLQLIGVDPNQYEIQTEWTHSGQRQVAEAEGVGNPHMLRLWNTGGHYEPITIPGGAATPDLQHGQTNARLLRPARPLWMQAITVELAAALGEELEGLEEAAVEEAAKNKGVSKSEGSKTEVVKTSAPVSFQIEKVKGWVMTESATSSKQREITLTKSGAESEKLQAALLEIRPAMKEFGIEQEALNRGDVVLKIFLGKKGYVFSSSKKIFIEIKGKS